MNMELSSSSGITSGLGPIIAGGFELVNNFLEKLRVKVCDIARNTKKVGQDDPRRVVHSLKVGLALVVVSMLYFYQPLYDSFGASAMWAVMTVVVVFEFSVGATLAKGCNRGMATILAGGLGIGAHHLANLSGHSVEPILLGFFVFFQATISTFIRFFPKIKARHDYGLLIFILTFALVSVSGFRDDEIIELAHKRTSTILIGGLACLVISSAVCPVWAGEDLHNSIAINLEKLSDFLQGFGDEYFGQEKHNSSIDKSFLRGYKRVINSKSTEESLANFAWWEPGHGRFRFRHPWKQYLEVAALSRQCAYRIDALDRYLNADSEESLEVKYKIKEACTTMSKSSGEALKELALAIRTMTKPTSANSHVENAKSAAESINSLSQLDIIGENTDVLQIIPVLTVSSILVDVVNCTSEIAETVSLLATKADFKIPEPKIGINLGQGESLKSRKEDIKCRQIVIHVAGN